MKNILIVNGVSLNRLGAREINVYGSTDFLSYLEQMKLRCPDVNLSYFQSDDLNEIVAAILNSNHQDAIILNPGAYTHTAIVLADAIKAINIPVIEVHISNLFGRENYRKNSQIAGVCQGFISGFGLKGYELAIRALSN
ncbi:MAG: type II 3-dehydroquinate dehydratase [Bacteroidales bacterium]|jgi:3-dehydroquinate dehydratase-2|nr:type II 3-dehydroquinate dehydratase [Bacteroidales bacterium]